MCIYEKQDSVLYIRIAKFQHYMNIVYSVWTLTASYVSEYFCEVKL